MPPSLKLTIKKINTAQKRGYLTYIDAITLKRFKLLQSNTHFNHLRYTFKHDTITLAKFKCLQHSNSISKCEKRLFYTYTFCSTLYKWIRLPFKSYKLTKPIFEPIQNSFCINLNIQRLTPPALSNYSLIETEEIMYRPKLFDCFHIVKLAFLTKSFTEPLYHIYYHFLSSLSDFPSDSYVYEDSGSIFQKTFIQVCHDNNINVDCYMSCFVDNLFDGLFEASTGSNLITNQMDTVSLFEKYNIKPPRFITYESNTFTGHFVRLLPIHINHYSLVFPHFYRDIDYCKSVIEYALGYFFDREIPIIVSLHPQCYYLQTFLAEILTYYPRNTWKFRPNDWTDHYFIGSSLAIVGSDSSLVTLAKSYNTSYTLIPSSLSND